MSSISALSFWSERFLGRLSWFESSGPFVPRQTAVLKLDYYCFCTEAQGATLPDPTSEPDRGFARQLDRDSKISLVHFSNLHQKAFSIGLKILLDSRFLLVRKPTSSCCELPSNFPEENAKNTGIKCDPGYGLRDLLVLR